MLQIWRMLCRRKLLLFASIFCCAVVAMVTTAKQVGIYRAKTTIEFQSSGDNVVVNIPQLSQSGTAQISDDSYIETQVGILKSRSLVGKVVSKLGLDQSQGDERRKPGKLDGVLALLGLPSRPVIPAKERALNDALDDFQIKPARMTRIVELSYDSPDPKLAAKFLNTLVTEYVNRASKHDGNPGSARTAG